MLHDDLSNPHLLFPRQNCVTCPNPPPCNCRADQVCERTIQTCSQCSVNQCVGSSSGGSGVSNGALAGAVVGCVLLLTIVVSAFLIWRRRARAKQAAILALEKNSISPYDLEGASVLSSPVPRPPGSPHSPRSPHTSIPGSPIADIRIYNGSLINLDATAPARLATVGSDGVDANPFSDAASTTTFSTNVIPIAYLPPSANSMSVADGMPPIRTSLPPSRPARSPDLNLRLPPNAISRASLVDAQGAGTHDLLAPRSPYAAQSTKSGVSRASSSRSSIISTASTTYERPTIVTSAKIGRQVLGVVRAEVVPIPPTPPLPGSAPQTPSLGATGLRARPSIRSPLAGPSFSHSDIELRHSPSPPPMPSPSGLSPTRDPFAEKSLRSPRSPTSQPLPPSRPESSMIPPSPTSPLSPPTEAGAQGRLLTPTRTELAQVTPRTQHFPRESASSFVSATSRADSIMNNAFVFLPATPRSDRQFSGPEDVRNRRTLGFSTGSNLSNVSSGLDAFPFHFGPGAGMPALPQSMSLSTLAEGGPVPPVIPHGFEGGPNATRASLDTLALSRDVEAYPLAYDRQDSVARGGQR